MPSEEVEKAPTTLRERLELALLQSEAKKIVTVPAPGLYPAFPTQFETERCVICKGARFDHDQTGITCGNPRCIAEVGANWTLITSILGSLAEKLGIEEKGLPVEDAAAMGKILEDEIDDREEIASDLENIGQILGIKTDDKNIKMLLEAIRAEVDSLAQVVKGVEAKLEPKE